MKRKNAGMFREIVKEILWIGQYVRKFQKQVLQHLLVGTLGVGMTLGAGIISKHLFDAVVGYDFAGIIPIGVCYVVMQLLSILCHAITGQMSVTIETTVNREIGGEVYDEILIVDWEAISEFHSGDLLNRVNNDVNCVSSCVTTWIPNVFVRSLQFVSALIIILYYDITLAVFALLGAPVTVLVSRVLAKRMRLYSRKVRKIGSKLMAFNGESFQNLQTIKALGVSDLYGRKLRSIQDEYCNAKLEYNRFSVSTGAFMGIIATVVSCICFGWGLYRLWTGHITYGTMLLFLQMATLLATSFKALANLVPSLISATTSAGRIMAITQLPKEKHVDNEKVEMLRKDKKGIVVEAKELEFSYNTGHKVFRKANFVANPGEVVAIIGPSGEGKTTLLRLLLGIVSIKGGSLTVRDQVSKEPLAVGVSTRKLFAYVPQDNTLFAGTIAENLRCVKEDATDEQLNEVLKTACAYHFVHRIPTGLKSRVKEQGGGFSEGQIQRLSIARAMLTDAPILLLDEATSALDADTEERVIQNIMQERANRTCIITTHRPSVLRTCDRIYKIENGIVTECDKTDIIREL